MRRRRLRARAARGRRANTIEKKFSPLRLSPLAARWCTCGIGLSGMRTATSKTVAG
jgi:hypothetical protein